MASISKRCGIVCFYSGCTVKRSTTAVSVSFCSMLVYMYMQMSGQWRGAQIWI